LDVDLRRIASGGYAFGIDQQVAKKRSLNEYRREKSELDIR